MGVAIKLRTAQDVVLKMVGKIGRKRMGRLIDADKLEANMYHEAFETDTDMQKWDSGCWIRYKMFENQIEKMPTVDAVEVVRCKDCKYYDGECLYPVCNYHENNVNETDFCAWGERKENE